jgi:tetratricopeptide (TPR) repeat protein
VAKKKKQHAAPALSAGELRRRAERAVAEGRFQQALELSKQLQKLVPTPANLQLLRDAYLGRARQLRTQGFLRDAHTTLQASLAVPGQDQAWLEQVAEEMAAAGEVSQALHLLQRFPDSPALPRVLARAADAAVQHEAAGRKLLPENLHADFDRVLQAFRHLEAGQDEPARETLAGLGLRSPFLEWKVLLRGLLAYYQKDDVRALENWQRLAPDRLPARLAAPLRFQIDPSYRTAQPPEAQNTLRKQADRLQSPLLVQQLRDVQKDLMSDEHFQRALRRVEPIIEGLRQEFPQLLPRLAACFYWAVINVGRPEDVLRYQRLFGTPADDPTFDRLRALAYEQGHSMESAHRHWQKYEQALAAHPKTWPGEQLNRARALVWYHMGQNAVNVPDVDDLPELPPYFRDHPDRPRPLNPGAEQCFRHCLELAPDHLEAAEALFHLYLEKEDAKKAEETALALLERFPQHAQTLEELADFYMHHEDYGKALTMYERALRVNPLDRKLRGRLGTAHLFHGRSHVEAGRFDEARSEYQLALDLSDGRDKATVYCKWAACEFKAGNAERAEELLQQAREDAGSRLAVAYSVLIETIRLKLAPALKRRFDKEFNEALAEPPSPAGARAAAKMTAAHQLAGVTYRGQKTHEKKVLAYLDRAKKADFTEDQLDGLCWSLLELKATKLLRAFTGLGKQRFPRNPYFPFYEAESYFQKGPERMQIWQVRPLLEEARRLAEALPRDERQQSLLATIQERWQMLAAINPFFMGQFEDMFGDFFGDEFYDDDDEDEDDGW